MSLSTYATFHFSSSEWLGEIPGHWKTGKLRWLTKRFSGGTPDKSNQNYWTNGTIPWLNSGSVNSPIIYNPSEFITDEAFENSSAKWIPKGALVMALAGQGKTKGMVAQLAIDSTCNQSLAAIIPMQEISARFLYWWLSSNYQNIRNMAGGDLRDGLNLEFIGEIPCPVVPIDCHIPWVSLNDTKFLKENEYIGETTIQINNLGIKNSSARLLPKRSVVFSRDATIGRCAITTRPMAVSQHFIAWICGPLVVPEFLLKVLRSMEGELQRLTFGAIVKTIGMPDVRSLSMPLPTVKEQIEIINFMNIETKKIDDLLAECARSIGLLKERRSALISAAVTGKIDVRGLVSA